MRRFFSHSVSSIALAAMAPLLLPAETLAGTITSVWTSGATGNWSDAALWSSTDFPNNGNGGETFDAEVGGSAAASVTVDQNISIDKLTLRGAATITVDATNTLNVVGDGTPAGASLWTSSGTLTGTGTTTVSGGLTVQDTNNSAGQNPTLSNHTLVNTGTVTLTGGQEGWVIVDGAVFENQATFDLVSDAPVSAFGGAPGTVRNTGTGSFTKSAGAGTSVIAADVENAGSVEAQQGTLSLRSAVTGGGSFEAAAGAELEMTGNVNLGASSALTGAGTTTFNGATATVAGSFDVSGTTAFEGDGTTMITSGGNELGSFELRGAATLDVSGDAMASGASSLWTSSGMLTGTGTTTVSGGLTVQDTNNSAFDNPVLSGHTLVNTGTVTLTGGQEGWVIENGAVFENQASFDLVSDAPVTVTGGATPGTIRNTSTGTFTKSAGAGTSVIAADLENAGSVEAQQGTLRLRSAVTGGGSFEAAAGAELEMTGNVNLGASSALTGAGTTTFNGATATVAGSFDVSGTTAFEGDGTTMITSGGNELGSFELRGAATLDVSGDAMASGASSLWTSSGTLTGTGTTTVSGGLTVQDTNNSAGQNPTLSNHTLVNTGTVTLTGGQEGWVIVDGAVFENQGTFDLVSDAPVSAFGGAPGRIRNTSTGIFTKSAGTGTSIVTSSAENAGTVDVQTGTLRFTADYTQTAGTTKLTGGTLSSVETLDIQGGSVEGSGTIAASVQSDGNLSPGIGMAAGALAITGTLDLRTSSDLTIMLGGLDQGLDYDFVSVIGTVDLGGVLRVSFLDDFDTIVQNSDLFTVLETGAALAGVFSNVANGERLTTAEGHSFLVSYGAGSTFAENSVVLSDFQPIPEPSAALLFAAGLAALSASRRRRSCGARRSSASLCSTRLESPLTERTPAPLRQT